MIFVITFVVVCRNLKQYCHHCSSPLLFKYSLSIAPSKGISSPESGKFGAVVSGILGFGIQNTVQGIWNTTKDWNPESKFHMQHVESEIPRMESRIQACLGFPSMGKCPILTEILMCSFVCLVFSKVSFHALTSSFIKF